MATKTVKVKVEKKDMLKLYIDYVLKHNERPKSVYAFASHNDMEEAEFYKTYASFESLEKTFIQKWLEGTVEKVKGDKIYISYNSMREKLLAFYFALFEEGMNYRSFVKFILGSKAEQMKLPSQKLTKEVFTTYVNELLNEAYNNREVKDRKFLSDRYADALWLHFCFLMQFWLNDESAGFEKTDAAIEKSVNMAFDLLGQTALDSILDFSKFMFEQRKSNL
jgi:Tetracyclin repressor-like, C-terminal domain